MKNNKSFTLIELLVVIAIIGLLSSIVLVALKGARERAQNAKMDIILEQIDRTARIDYENYENWSPDVCPIAGSQGGASLCRVVLWSKYLRPKYS